MREQKGSFESHNLVMETLRFMNNICGSTIGGLSLKKNFL